MKELLIVAVIIGAFPAYLVYDAYTNPKLKPHRHCGIIHDKFIASPYEYRSGKRTLTASAELYVITKLDSGGFIRIPQSTNEFYGRNIGERVCYQISDESIENYKN